MRHNKINNQKKRYLFNAVVRRWNAKQRQYGVHFKRVVALNTIGAVALMSANISWAQQEKKTTVLREVVVTGRQEKDKTYKAETVSSPKYTGLLRDTPQTINVVPKAVMQEQNATTLRDVLRNVPGISMQAGEGGTPNGDQLSIRGFSARTDIFVDGVRDFGGYTRDAFNTQQVEVTKGPTSVYAGRGSTGGSINMVSKMPEMQEFFAGAVGFGTDQYKRVSLDINQPIKKIENAAFRLNVMGQDEDIAGRDVVENTRWGVAPTVTFGIGTPTQATFSYFHLDQDNLPDYGIPWVPSGNTDPVFSQYIDQAPPVDWSNFYGLRDRDYEKVKTDFFSTQIKHDFSDDLSLRNTMRFGRTDRDSIVTAPRFADLDPVTAGTQSGAIIQRGDWKSRDQVSTIFSNQTDFTVKFDTADFEHNLVSGFEFAREGDENQTRAATGGADPTTNIYNPNPDDAYLSNIQRTGAKSAADSNSFGIFAFDTIKITKWLDWLVGLRGDRFSVDYHPSGAQSVDRDDEKLTWRTGLVVKPAKNGSVYVAYGTSFNPSAEGLTLTTTGANTNIDLSPEESESYEVGTKWDFFDNLLGLTAAIFRTNKTNARTEDPASSTDILVLEGEQHVQGIELGINGNITEKWNVAAGYTFMESNVDSSKNQSEVGRNVTNTPQNSFSVWTTYQLPWKFQIGGGVQYVGTRFNSTTTPRKAPDFLLGSAMVAYEVNEDITMRLNIANLGDAEYIDQLGGGHFVPGTGRTVMLTTDFKF